MARRQYIKGNDLSNLDQIKLEMFEWAIKFGPNELSSIASNAYANAVTAAIELKQLPNFDEAIKAIPESQQGDFDRLETLKQMRFGETFRYGPNDLGAMSANAYANLIRAQVTLLRGNKPFDPR